MMSAAVPGDPLHPTRSPPTGLWTGQWKSGSMDPTSVSNVVSIPFPV